MRAALMRHLRAAAMLALAATLTLVGVFVGTGSATAAGSTSSSNPYPPTTCANLAVSATTIPEGGTITVTGTDYVANQAVSILFIQGSHTIVLASVTSSATGTFSHVVTLPAGFTGQATITTTGGTPAGCVLDPVIVTISAS